MDIESFYKMLFELYATQEKLKIKYTVDNKNFSTKGYK